MPRIVSALAQKQFIDICFMDRKRLIAKVLTMSPKQLINFYRDMQIALTEYAKAKPILSATGGEIVTKDNFTHMVQWNALSIIKLIERKVRQAYYKAIIPEIIKRNVMYAKNEDKTRAEARRAWEKFKRKFSY